MAVTNVIIIPLPLTSPPKLPTCHQTPDHHCCYYHYHHSLISTINSPLLSSYHYYRNVLPMVWRVTNEPVDCRPSRGTNKHTQDRKRCSLLDDNSTATADYDSAHANYTVNYIRQLQNHDYIHMTTTTSYKSILLPLTNHCCCYHHYQL